MQSLHYQELWWPIVGEQIECEFNRSYKSKGRIATLWDDIGPHIGIQQCVHCLGAITPPWYCLLYEWKCFIGQVLPLMMKHENMKLFHHNKLHNMVYS